MAKFASSCLLLALVATTFGSPLHSKLDRGYVNDVVYHVSIQVLDWWNDIPKHSCSGVLLADRWILTTAECIHKAFDNLPRYSQVVIQGGEANLHGYYRSYPTSFVVHDEADIGLINILQPMRESYCCLFVSLPKSPLVAGEVVEGVLTGQSTQDEWALELAETSVVALDGTSCGNLSDVAPHSLCSLLEPVTTPVPEPSSTEAPAPTNPSTSDAPVEPSTSDAPVEPSTTEEPVEPSTSDAPVEPSTSDAPVEPSTTEAPVEPSTSDAPVEPSTSDAPVEPSTTDSSVQGARKMFTSAPTCFADIGGPLVRDNVVVGLVSRGTGCVNGQTATVLTDVSAFTDWIKATINDDDYFD